MNVARVRSYQIYVNDRDSIYPAAQRHIALRLEQHHTPLLIRYPKHKHIGHKARNRPRSKVHCHNHQPPDKIAGLIQLGELCRGLFDAEWLATINPQFVRGFPGVLIDFAAHNAADAHVEILKCLQWIDHSVQYLMKASPGKADTM